MKFVIMAGGSGSKLWPYSRQKAPKQFIKIIGDKTLFQMNVGALLKQYKAEDIFVSTTEEVAHFAIEQVPEIPKENYIIEPEIKNTGPASCFAMAKVAARYPDEVVHFYVQPVVVREPEEKYLEMIGEMEDLVKRFGKLITGMMVPKYTEMGSDLFVMGKKIVERGMEVYEIEEFINVVKERMTLEQVEEISRRHVVGTHTNHYTWRPKEFFEAVSRLKPDWYETIEELRGVFGQENERELVAEIYARFVSGRIEELTTELIKEGKVMAVELPFEWRHITTWDDVYRYRKEKGLPMVKGEVVEVESSDNLVLSEGKRLISLVGMKEVVVVETDSAVLIVPRVMAGKVADVMDRLKEKGREKYQ